MGCENATHVFCVSGVSGLLLFSYSKFKRLFGLNWVDKGLGMAYDDFKRARINIPEL